MYSGKTLLITGGTGSFGSAVLKRFSSTNIKEIRIFSRDEKKQSDMRNVFQDPRIKYYIGDVRDRTSVDFAMKGVDYVFHAAALKQVPSCEFYPLEAVKTNILGTENVIASAIDYKVKKVIGLSTDKAAYPINAMGISKAMMEKLIVSKSRTLDCEGETLLICTRYGNVMGSRGSVIPLFIDQITGNAQLTITDPEMTRFFMSLEDAVDLVLYAFEHGKQGDLFVQKAPAATIKSLALAIQDLFNSKEDFKYIGTRHGEKPYETLLTREEMSRSEDLGDYFRVPADTRDLDYTKYFTEGEAKIAKLEDYNSNNADQLDVAGVKQLLLKLDFVQEALKSRK